MFEFGHEGVLYRKSFVMYDEETESLWVHTTGRAVSGAMRGATLEFLPSEVVPWSDWRARYPDTVVLDRGGEDEGFMGTYTLDEDAEEFGISVGQGTDVKLVPYEQLLSERVVQTDDRVVLMGPESDALRAYRYDGPVLSFDESGVLVDGEGRGWDPLTGNGVRGSAEALERLPATAWLMERWRAFF